MWVRWQNVCSASFSVNKGVQQGGILSPFLFRFYIRDLIISTISLNIGCNFAGRPTNVSLLAYADDIVLLAPSWRALQCLLKAVEAAGININMTFNTRKTVCMVFNLADRSKIVANSFPAFTLCNCCLKFVNKFKYLGHIIDNSSQTWIQDLLIQDQDQDQDQDLLIQDRDRDSRLTRPILEVHD